MAATLSGAKKSGTGTDPAMTPRKRAMCSGWPCEGARCSCCISGGGGDSRSARPQVSSYIGQGGGVAGPLVAASGVEVAVEAVVDGVGEELGVAEGVEHPLGRDRVLVVAGVADEGPARARRAGGRSCRRCGRSGSARPARPRPPGRARRGTSASVSANGLGHPAAVARGLARRAPAAATKVSPSLVGVATKNRPGPRVQLDAVEVEAAPVRVDGDRRRRLHVVGRGARRRGRRSCWRRRRRRRSTHVPRTACPAPSWPRDADDPVAVAQQLGDA